MQNQFSNINRYSDDDLAEFKVLIDKKLDKANRDLFFMEEQIQDLKERMDSDGDWMDETSNHSEREMLHSMIGRQKKHIQDLEHALMRIRNRTYGICAITGEMIDKRRLLAVPTTTKSLAAKTALAMPQVKPKPQPRPNPTKKTAPKIISKIISKKVTPPVVDSSLDDDDWDEDDDDFLDVDDNLEKFTDIDDGDDDGDDLDD